MNLTDKQKEIIKLMQEGYELFTWSNEHFGNKSQLVYSARIYELDKCLPGGKHKTKRIHHSTFLSLRKLNLINPKPYDLTKLGKTIKL